MCSIAIVAVYLGTRGGISAEQEPINAVLDEFMTYMVAEDIQSAFALFSPHVQEQVSVDQLNKLLQFGDNILFKGYESIAVSNITLNTGVNLNPNGPQGKNAQVRGNVYYRDGSVGDFTAVLEKVDGEWMLYNITINVPMERYQP